MKCEFKRWECPKDIKDGNGKIIIKKNRMEPKCIKGENFVCFRCKACANKYLDEYNPKLFLFQKQFEFYTKDKIIKTQDFVCSSRTNIYNISSNQESHYYEYYNDTEKIKLGLDIDLAISDNDNYDQNQFDKIVMRAIKYINSLLKQYKPPQLKIIVLNASTKDKYSAHIIYTNIFFSSVIHIKYFICSNNNFLKFHIDNKIYRTGCMRIIWNSKIGKNNELKYHRGINYERISDKKLFNDSLLTYIPKDAFHIDFIKPEIPKIIEIKKKNKGKAIIQNGHNTVPISEIKKYLNMLSSSRIRDYEDWLKVGFTIYNSNNSLNGFKLWNEWSKKAPNYQDKEFNQYKWNTFKKSNIGLGTLRFMAKQDSPELYNSINKRIDNKNFETIDINQEYLLDIDENIKKSDSVMATNIRKWVKNEKALSILSPYNTGKTSLIIKILQSYKNKFKSVLFITYRKTLTGDLFFKFKSFDFYNYMEGDCFDEERLICQIESLYKIYPEKDEDGFITNKVRSYDLIILDEIVSSLNHFSSPTVINPSITFDLFRSIVYNSKRILSLDGDFDNRANCFISNITKKHIIIKNTIKKDNNKYIFIDDKKYYDSMINRDLKNRKNIVIISLSSASALEYYEKYNKKYKCCLHISLTAKENKETFNNLSEVWKTKQCLIYSPTLESGCDFNLEHFDKKYVLLSPKSTSPRGLLQMIARVRKVKDNNIHIFTNRLPYKETAPFYTYDEIEDYVKETYQERMDFLKTKYDDSEDKYVFKYENNLYNKILIYNMMEEYNKSPGLFIPMLLSLLREKGCSYSANFANINTVYKKDNIIKEKLANAQMIDRDTAKKYRELKINNDLDVDKMLSLHKYIIKRTFYYDLIIKEEDIFMFVDNEYVLDKNKKVEVSDPITRQFLDKYYKKEYILYNLKLIKGLIDQEEIVEDEVNRQFIVEFKSAEKMVQVNAVKKLIEELGFKDYGTDHRISRAVFDKNMQKTLKESKIFTDIDRSIKLFKLGKYKFVDLDGEDDNKKRKAFLNFVNALLRHYGIKIFSKSSGNYEKKKNSYYLDILEDFKDFI